MSGWFSYKSGRTRNTKEQRTRIFQSHQQETLCKPCKKTFKTPWMNLNSQPLIHLGSHQKPLRKGLWRRKGTSLWRGKRINNNLAPKDLQSCTKSSTRIKVWWECLCLLMERLQGVIKEKNEALVIQTRCYKS